MVRTDFSPYEGPLAERLIESPLPEFPTNFSIRVDSAALQGFEHWLARNPLYVRAPGHAYLGWGLRTYPDIPSTILVQRYNLLLTPTEQPLGPYLGDAGAMLAWAFSVLDHYHLPYDPIAQGKSRNREQLIAWYGEDPEGIDWQAVAELLRSTGRAVPADLFEQPTR